MKLFSLISSRLRNRDDSEHTQVFVRLILVSAFSIGFYIFDFQFAAMVGSVYFTLTIMMLIWIIFYPSVNHIRRIISMCLDGSGIALVLIFGGESGAPILALYPFIMIGNGFRYGNRYLLGAMFIALCSFLTVCAFSSYWMGHPWLSSAMALMIIMAPLYAYQLIDKLHSSVKEAEHANRAKSNFLAVMSHELRTPLHGIIGLQDLLKRELKDLPPQQQQHLDLAQSSAHALNALIDDVLDLSKIEAGSTLVNVSTFDLNALLHDTLMVFLAETNEKEIALELNMQDVPLHISTDKMKLKQILLNIIGNAEKFTEQGKISIHAYMSGDLLHVEVCDTGVGIPAEDRGRLFESFVQLSHELERKGTGLGTTIAMKFAKLMGGNISVQSEPGKGSTFTISIPVETVGDECVTECMNLNDFKALDVQTPDVNVSHMENLKLLLAEDDPVARFLAVETLERAGLNVDVAENGLVAWERLQEGDYDVLITDVRMPGLDGIELSKKVREHEQGGDKRIKIIGLSADALQSVIERAQEAGMDAFIAKPISSNELMHKLALEFI